MPHLDDARDVRVVEQRADARLVEKHPHELIVRGQMRQDPLDHDQRPQPRQLARQREERFRHPALRQPPDQPVAPDARPRRIARGILVVRWSNDSHLIFSIHLPRPQFSFLLTASSKDVAHPRTSPHARTRADQRTRVDQR